MSKFSFEKTPIEDLWVITPTVFGDDRGYFMETYHYQSFVQEGLNMVFVQDNQSKSKKGVLRGLHFQREFPQGKLVRVTKGEVFDVAVDIRIGSPTFGKWHGELLSEENKKMFYVPEGFAHGFLVLSSEAEFVYKCTNYYHPQSEGGILWNDGELAIDWPLHLLGGAPVSLSAKDQGNLTFKDFKELME